MDFNPRSPRGERHIIKRCAPLYFKFQSTLPARGATKAACVLMVPMSISIHAPREGSDDERCTQTIEEFEFQSTLPARGATVEVLADEATFVISIHAPREGSDAIQRRDFTQRGISIHAPREGSDN